MDRGAPPRGAAGTGRARAPPPRLFPGRPPFSRQWERAAAAAAGAGLGGKRRESGGGAEPEGAGPAAAAAAGAAAAGPVGRSGAAALRGHGRGRRALRRRRRSQPQVRSARSSSPPSDRSPTGRPPGQLGRRAGRRRRPVSWGSLPQVARGLPGRRGNAHPPALFPGKVPLGQHSSRRPHRSPGGGRGRGRGPVDRSARVTRSEEGVAQRCGSRTECAGFAVAGSPRAPVGQVCPSAVGLTRTGAVVVGGFVSLCSLLRCLGCGRCARVK